MTAFEIFNIIFTILYGTALAWVCLTLVQQGKKLAVIERITDSIERRFDLFSKNEIDTLKEIVKSVKKDPD